MREIALAARDLAGFHVTQVPPSSLRDWSE